MICIFDLANELHVCVVVYVGEQEEPQADSFVGSIIEMRLTLEGEAISPRSCKWIQSPLGLCARLLFCLCNICMLALIVTQLTNIRVVTLGGCIYSDAAAFLKHFQNSCNGGFNILKKKIIFSSSKSSSF